MDNYTNIIDYINNLVVIARNNIASKSEVDHMFSHKRVKREGSVISSPLYIATCLIEDDLLLRDKSRETVIKHPDFDTKIHNYLNSIKEYATFIRHTAEKCYMYKNDESSSIYVEEITNKNILNIFFKVPELGYKVKISFEKSSIDNNINPLQDFVNSADSSIEIITIEVVRTYGKMMSNKYIFISGETPKYNSPADKILLEELLRYKLPTIIRDNFFSIADNIQSCYGFEQTIYWKDVIKNGLWIRKRSAK